MTLRQRGPQAAPPTRSRSTRATCGRTGISAADRAHTIRVLADSATEPHDLTRPGHVVPLRAVRRRRAAPARAHRGRGRPGPAGRADARPARSCELVNDDGSMMRAPAVPRVRRRARPGDDLDRRPDRATGGAPSRSVERVAETGAARPRTASSARSATAAASTASSTSRWSCGDIGDGEDVLVRVHSECLTGDVFGSLRCDCGPQLQAALARGRRGGPRRRALHARPRGPRHRAGAQAAGLPAAGRRPRHRRRQPRARPAGRRARLRHRRADPAPTSGVAVDAAAHQQPGQAGRARGLRPADHRPGAAADRAPTDAQPALPARPSATGWATSCPTSADRTP